MVYLVNAENTKLYKIGYTCSVEKRLRTLQTGCPYKLKLIKEVEGNPEHEKHVHEMWKYFRKEGEWFEFEEDMVDKVCRTMKPKDTKISDNIVDVISCYIDLTQHGRSFFGLCPFHQEKTPSFSVNPEKQIYKCFGCGAGGGIISFIMQWTKLNYLPCNRSEELLEEKGIAIKKEFIHSFKRENKHTLLFLEAIDLVLKLEEKTKTKGELI